MRIMELKWVTKKKEDSNITWKFLTEEKELGQELALLYQQRKHWGPKLL